MSRSDRRRARPRHDDLPPAMRSLWRTFQLGYRAEPKLLTLSLGLAMLMMLPDALLALWLKWIVDGALDGRRGAVMVAGVGLAVGRETEVVVVPRQPSSRAVADRQHLVGRHRPKPTSNMWRQRTPVRVSHESLTPRRRLFDPAFHPTRRAQLPATHRALPVRRAKARTRDLPRVRRRRACRLPRARRRRLVGRTKVPALPRLRVARASASVRVVHPARPGARGVDVRGRRRRHVHGRGRDPRRPCRGDEGAERPGSARRAQRGSLPPWCDRPRAERLTGARPPRRG